MTPKDITAEMKINPDVAKSAPPGHAQQKIQNPKEKH